MSSTIHLWIRSMRSRLGPIYWEIMALKHHITGPSAKKYQVLYPNMNASPLLHVRSQIYLKRKGRPGLRVQMPVQVRNLIAFISFLGYKDYVPCDLLLLDST